MLKDIEVERDNYGEWTHPEFDSFCGERELVPLDELRAWEDNHGIETKVSMLEDEREDDPAFISFFESDNPNLSTWNPEPPDIEWRMLSIHDTEDGPVTVWYRRKPESEVSNDVP